MLSSDCSQIGTGSSNTPPSAKESVRTEFGWIQRTADLAVLVRNSTKLSGDDFRGPHLDPARARFADGKENDCGGLAI
jgi:hypothetical protein